MARILWLNGPFGVGKSTVAKLVGETHPEMLAFDPEWVGFALRAHGPDGSTGDFQDLPSWRREHLSRHEMARTWLERAADAVIDTSELTAGEVAEAVETVFSGC